jgi:hypothetical protein
VADSLKDVARRGGVEVGLCRIDVRHSTTSKVACIIYGKDMKSYQASAKENHDPKFTSKQGTLRLTIPVSFVWGISPMCTPGNKALPLNISECIILKVFSCAEVNFVGIHLFSLTVESDFYEILVFHLPTISPKLERRI